MVLPADDRVPELGGSSLAPLWLPLHAEGGADHRAILSELRQVIARVKTETEGKVNATIVSDALAERILATRNVGVERRSPTRTPNREVQASSQPDVLMYRIFWKGNQKWSKWYIPGVNDRDWKNTSERVWRYFEDHRHEVVLLGR